MMFRTTHEFCRRNGFTKTLSLTLTYNQPSITAIKQIKYAGVIAKFETRSLLFGIYKSAILLEGIKKSVEEHDIESISHNNSPSILA